MNVAIDQRRNPDEVLAAGEFPLTRKDLGEIASMIYSDAGIALNESKASLVYSRLSKHIRQLGLRNFREYCQLVASPAGSAARREMLSFLPYKDNAAELAKRLAPAVQPKKVKKAMELLAKLGLVERKEDGSWQASSTFIHTGPDVQSLLIPKFHQSMTRLAEEAITRFPKDERYFSSSTVSLSEKTYHEIIALIRATRQEVLKKVGEDPDPDRVYHLNMQLFPLTAGAPTAKAKRRKRTS